MRAVDTAYDMRGVGKEDIFMVEDPVYILLSLSIRRLATVIIKNGGNS
jgi:hypothetical protein